MRFGVSSGLSVITGASALALFAIADAQARTSQSTYGDALSACEAVTTDDLGVAPPSQHVQLKTVTFRSGFVRASYAVSVRGVRGFRTDVKCKWRIRQNGTQIADEGGARPTRFAIPARVALAQLRFPERTHEPG